MGPNFTAVGLNSTGLVSDWTGKRLDRKVTGQESEIGRLSGRSIWIAYPFGKFAKQTTDCPLPTLTNLADLTVLV